MSRSGPYVRETALTAGRAPVRADGHSTMPRIPSPNEACGPPGRVHGAYSDGDTPTSLRSRRCRQPTLGTTPPSSPPNPPITRAETWNSCDSERSGRRASERARAVLASSPVPVAVPSARMIGSPLRA